MFENFQAPNKTVSLLTRQYFHTKLAKLRSGLVSTVVDPLDQVPYKKSLNTFRLCQRTKSIKPSRRHEINALRLCHTLAQKVGLYRNSLKFNVTHHLYVDDTQIYLELALRNFNSNITELANCHETIQVNIE